MRRFGLSELQAEAIAEMKLKSLTGLEKGKIENEYLSLIKILNITELFLPMNKAFNGYKR